MSGMTSLEPEAASEARVASLPSLIRSSFDAAVQNGQIILFDTTSTETVEDSAGVQHLLHICPEIAAKPAPRASTPDLETQPARDVLAGDRWAPGEHVVDLEGYPLVSNLNALAREHIMAVTPHPFRPQASDLLPSDLFVAHQLVQAYGADGRELLCFFNGGPLSGASQAHLHMQFFPFQSIPPLNETVARSLSPQLTPGILPLPYLHLYISLPSLPEFSSSPSPEDKITISTTLHTAFSSLLSFSTFLLSKLPESELPPAGAKRRSYNFFLTREHMFLVPRTERIAKITRVTSVGQRDGAEHLLMSINGLPICGYWHVGSSEEIEDLKAFGISRILIESGYRSELFTS